MSPSTRTAEPHDLQVVLDLAAAVHHPVGPIDVPAITAAVRDGLVGVAEVAGVVVGYVILEHPLPQHVRITDIGVRADHRRCEVASALLARVLVEARTIEATGGTVSAVADPAATGFAGLLFSNGFCGTRTMRTGPGGSLVRLYYQHKVRVQYVDPDARHLVPVADVEQLIASLSTGDHAVTAVAMLSGEPAFEISRFEQDDPAALQSAEAQAGIAFAGAMLAAVTFLLGFSFASSRYPDDVRLLLIGATFATTISLIIYGSAAGELARIRSNAFGRIMKWGNVFSEYGGVLPFLISLPITYAQVTDDTWSAVVTGAALSVGLIVYEWSGFSIAHRFRWTFTTGALTVFTSAAPTGCVVMAALDLPSWPWTAALVAALSARILIYLFRRGPESGISEHRRTWQIRL